MTIRIVTPRLSTVYCVLALGILSGLADAQATFTVAGKVTDSLGTAVSAAQVGITGLPYRVVTDVKGTFRLSNVPAGELLLTVRRLGFSPVVVPLTLSSLSGDLEAVTVRLLHVPAALPTVTVKKNRVDYTGRLAGYYQRLEKRNSGYFITRDQIDREHPRTMQDLLQRVPGISGSRMRGGGSGVRMRGRLCAPLVWLDGTPMAAGEVDINAISPQTIHGIELYSGATTVPVRFMLNRQLNSCGTIVLWSRGPDTDPLVSRHQPAVDLGRLVASLSVYTVDQVDSKAEPIRDSMAVGYPPPLFAEAMGGAVIAEYVVDSAGRMEAGTFGIISSTHPLFSEAVKASVEGTTFRPARLKGRAVRQLVLQPFSFVAPKAR